MDLREIARHRWPVAAALALLILVFWYFTGYRPRSEELARQQARVRALGLERQQLATRIAEEQRLMREERKLPTRVVPALAGEMSAIDRLNYFLESITAPANDLDLSYFSVTPQAPVSRPSYEEIPFSISVSGNYAALADYLYQLEYARDFVVRNPVLTGTGDDVRAEFGLSALLLREAIPPDAPRVADPGRPTSLELARDPFTRPPARLATGPDGRLYFLNVPPGLHLSGVMDTDGRRVAIINHEPYGVGATIDNKKITKIDDRGVEMTDDARTYFLEMEQPPRAPAPEGSRR